MATLIKGRYLLSPEGLQENWGVKVEDGIIREIGPHGSLTGKAGDEIVELSDQIILPGFINGHNHMYGVLSHGITAEVMVMGFSSFLDDFWWPCVEDRLDHRLVETTARWACVEMIESGVTAFADILEGPATVPGALEVERDVVEKAGLRALLSFEACERVSKENGETGLQENLELIRRTSGKEHLVKGFMSVHTLFTCRKEFLRRAKEMVEAYECPIHMHMSESVFEPEWCREHYGKSPAEVYEEIGYLDSQVLASQLVQVSEEELSILKSHGVRAVSMPLSNCEVGGGIAPVPRMLELGIPVGLGSDGYINNFFEVMRGAFLIHKANQQSTQVMPASKVYEMATSMGAEALGLSRCGSLREGNFADLITVELDTPTPVNSYNVYDQLILFRNPQNIVNVMVDGKWLKRDKKLTTLDKESVRREVEEAAREFWRLP